VLGFGYCALIEYYREHGLAESCGRWGLIAGIAAAVAHLVQAVGLNLSVANRSSAQGALLGFLWVTVPISGINFALMALVQIRVHGDHEVRSVGTASAAIAGGSMAMLVVLFFLGFGTVG
jgi:hypothetical protein